MKFEILINILFDLLSKKIVKARELALNYDVNIRTIYRYINNLEEAGVPIYTTRGINGGFSILDTFKLTSSFMTKSEFNKTIETLTSINNAMPDKLLESAINKLKSTFKSEYNNFQINSGSLMLDSSSWGDTKNYRNKIIILQKCIEENKELYIKYHDRNGEISERIIEPHLLLLKQGIWYTYAYCNLRKAFRFFKTGRIEQAKILDSEFKRKNIEKENISLDFFDNSKTTKLVKLEIFKTCLSDVEEWLGIENIKQKDSRYFAECNLPLDNGLISKIISFGKGIKVLEPIELKNKVLESAKEIIKLYSSVK